MKDKKSFIIKDGDLSFEGGYLLVAKGMEAVKETLKRRLLTQRGEDEIDKEMGVPWVEFFNAQIKDYDLKQSVVEQIMQTGLVYRASVKSFETRGAKAFLSVEAQCEDKLLSLEINYEIT